VKENKVSEEKENLLGIEQLFLDFQDYGYSYLNSEQTSSEVRDRFHRMDINKEFSKLGYEGGEIICIGHTYPTYGVIYWIFDSSIMSPKESRKLTDQFVEMRTA
jgi:hypothetical protein